MNVSSSDSVVKDRMSLKLLLLFLVTFFALLIGFVLYSIFTAMFAKNVAGMAVPKQPEVITIDPKLETELTKVLEFESEDDQVDENRKVVNDPFTDRSNISGIVANPANIIMTRPGSPGATSPKEADKARKRAESKNPRQSRDSSQNSPGNSNLGNNETEVVKKVSTADRLTIWRASAKYGISSDPEPELFDVEDLIPVGLVSGGDEKKEVIFYSQAADRILSFPIGTRLYDAWLTEATDDGVMFRFDDVYSTTRIKPWGRSVKIKSRKSG